MEIIESKLIILKGWIGGFDVDESLGFLLFGRGIIIRLMGFGVCVVHSTFLGCRVIAGDDGDVGWIDPGFVGYELLPSAAAGMVHHQRELIRFVH